MIRFEKIDISSLSFDIAVYIIIEKGVKRMYTKPEFFEIGCITELTGSSKDDNGWSDWTGRWYT